jgi:hypothetical protein
MAATNFTYTIEQIQEYLNDLQSLNQEMNYRDKYLEASRKIEELTNQVGGLKSKLSMERSFSQRLNNDLSELIGKYNSLIEKGANKRQCKGKGKTKEIIKYIKLMIDNAETGQKNIIEKTPACLKWKTLDSAILNEGLTWHNFAGQILALNELLVIVESIARLHKLQPHTPSNEEQ